APGLRELQSAARLSLRAMRAAEANVRSGSGHYTGLNTNRPRAWRETMKKFELVTDQYIEVLGRKLFRIRALVSFGNVKAGDIGGYVETESNVSQAGNAEVFGDAWVSGNARVFGNAEVSGDAWVFGDAEVSGDAWVFG